MSSKYGTPKEIAKLSDDDVIAILKQYRSAQRAVKKASEDVKFLQQTIKDFMVARQLTEYAVGDFRIVYRFVISNKFNLERLKGEQPEVYKFYCEEQQTRPLKVI